MGLSYLVLNVLSLFSLPTFSQSAGELDTRFVITLSRTDQSTEPAGVVAELTTSAVYPCEAYQIQTRVAQSTDTLTVYIGGMIRPGGCFAAFSNATGTAFLGDVLGIYYLRIWYRGVEDLYRVNFRKHSFLIQPLENEFTELKGQ